MSASSPVPTDHPLMVAWTAYKATDDYANTKRWAGHDSQATDGSLWAAFERGWQAAGGRPPFAEAAAPPTGEAGTLREWQRVVAEAAVDLRAEIKRWAIYCFTRHGHDAHLYNGLAKLAGMEPVDYPDANPFAQPFEWTEPVRRGVTIDGDEFVETVRSARIQTGDVVQLGGFGLRVVPDADAARVLTGNDGVDAIYRPIWTRPKGGTT